MFPAAVCALAIVLPIKADLPIAPSLDAPIVAVPIRAPFANSLEALPTLCSNSSQEATSPLEYISISICLAAAWNPNAPMLPPTAAPVAPPIAVPKPGAKEPTAAPAPAALTAPAFAPKAYTGISDTTLAMPITVRSKKFSVLACSSVSSVGSSPLVIIPVTLCCQPSLMASTIFKFLPSRDALY